MRDCIAIRHLPFEDLGHFEALLQDAGYRVRYLDAPAATLSEIENVHADLLIVLGGPVGAYDEDNYPFLTAELMLLKKRLAENRPTLGVCLGAQLMAKALGATVAPGPRAEIGWLPLTLSAAGSVSVLRHFDGEPVFHWHGDAVTLPPGATLLAATPDCAHQAFTIGANILGVQFHPEVTPQGLETWYVGHYRGLGDVNVHRLREDAARFGPELRVRGARFLREWLDGLKFTGA